MTTPSLPSGELEGAEHPQDECYCGDYRRDHLKDGPCKMNGLGHGGADPFYSFILSKYFARL